jgi:hypothetical protein
MGQSGFVRARHAFPLHAQLIDIYPHLVMRIIIDITKIVPEHQLLCLRLDRQARWPSTLSLISSTMAGGTTSGKRRVCDLSYPLY